jgi:hypothetical protein
MRLTQESVEYHAHTIGESSDGTVTPGGWQRPPAGPAAPGENGG